MFARSTAHNDDILDEPRIRSDHTTRRRRLADRARFEPSQDSTARHAFHFDKEITPSVKVTPDDVARRYTFRTNGVFAEVIRISGAQQVEHRFRGRSHLLVCGGGIRADGESWIEGLPRSSIRDLRRKLTFVPAGHEYYERHDEQRAALIAYVYFDSLCPAGQNTDIDETGLLPRLLFEDDALWTTSMKLRSLVGSSSEQERAYMDALLNVLKAEVLRHNRGERKRPLPATGGLAAWQQRAVSDFVEAHISQQLHIATLADLVRLSPYHFSRAFKKSFGVPPHRYHMIRRIERAKYLLSYPSISVTEVGMTLGFSETSSFSCSFRKIAGFTPSQYQRSFR